MPELPEVETTLRGIAPHIEHQFIENVVVRQNQLRWPVPSTIKKHLIGKKVNQLARRGKYLLFKVGQGTIISHLGMSGSFRIITPNIPPKKHDHIDIEFANNKILRFTDPRRFGAFLWTEQDPMLHPLLSKLGIEPFNHHFSGNYLWRKAQGRKTPIKSFIMDNKIVVGIGNIYATEALFYAGINPQTPAGNISQELFNQLAKSAKHILRKAIKQGGTTLKDFVNSEGKPGYFTFYLKVYNRAGLPCIKCQTTLIRICIGQRGAVYCESCQPYF